MELNTLIRILLLAPIIALTACASDVDKAKQLLKESLVITSDLQFDDVESHAGDAVCGVFTATTSYTSQSVNQPFIVIGSNLDKTPTALDWKIYCSESPSARLHEESGIGPFDEKSAELFKITKDFTLVGEAMEAYNEDVFSYPSEAQGLEALIKKPEGNVHLKNYREGGYLKELPLDPWGRPYLYSYTHWGRIKAPYELYSLGKSGIKGGSGIEADVSNSYLPYLQHIANRVLQK
ncbi:MAG: type II secretion system major pseudopilin GspG [Halioglobus sp.]